MKKFIKFVLIIIVLGIIGLLVFLPAILNKSIEEGVAYFGPKFLQVPVTLEEADISPYSGGGSLKGMLIGNPEGFKTDSSFKLGEVTISIDLASLATDTIIIEEILIDAPEITYETSMKGTNIGKILDNIQELSKTEGEVPAEKEPTEEKEESAEDKGPAKKVIINNFIFSNGKVRISNTLLAGNSLSVVLPKIHMKDIGKESGGTSMADAAKEIFGELNKSIMSVAGVVDKPLEMLNESADKLKEKLKESNINIDTDKIKESATGLIKGLGGLFGGDKDK